MNPAYTATVQLLLAVAPLVFESRFFAMKGGTALNLFVQDLPRLSVDIDVVFTSHEMPRDDALAAIAGELAAAKARIEKRGFAARLHRTKSGDEAKLFVTDGPNEVKVEVNHVFRGTALPVVRTSLTPVAQEMFAANIELPVLDTAELYGSKLVAALDRQHPRDLFDVKCMVDRFGLPASFVDCFVVYLAGHNRPVHEVLFATPQPLTEVFVSEFEGMTNVPVTLGSLEATRTWLFDGVPGALTANHRAFLLSLVEGRPKWELMPFVHLKDLPAIRWKLANLDNLGKKHPARFAQQHAALAAGFVRLDS
ncbi:nucleotidyl transferase AbiEii/AbiGii toxin family protein [soil metagenome]